MSADPTAARQALEGVVADIARGLSRGSSLGGVSLPTPSLLVGWVAAVDELTAGEALAAVCSIWHHEARVGEWSPDSARKYAMEARRFVRHAAINGHDTLDSAADSAEEWVYSAVRRAGVVTEAAVATLRLRRATVRALYVTARALGLTTARPLLDLVLPPAEEFFGKRPMDDDEMRLLRETADVQRGNRAPVCLALGRCGAGTSEMGNVLIKDVSLRKWTIRLRGSSRINDRTVRIWNKWDHAVLGEWIATREDGWGPALLATSRENDVQSAMSASLAALITDARLAARGEVTPNSVRAWAGSRVFEDTKDLFATSAFLGHNSLDQTVKLIGIETVENRLGTFNFQPGSPGLAS